MGAQRRTQNRWCLGTGPMVHAPEDPTPTPAVNRRVDIHGLAQGLEGTGSLFVGKKEE